MTATRQALLLEAQLAIADVEPDAAAVMQHICDHAQRLTGADSAVIELRDGEFMTCAAATGAAVAHLGLQVAMNASISGLAAETGQPLRSEDCAVDLRVDAAACRRVGVRSMVVVPLRRGGQVLGVLEVLAAQPAAFTDAGQASLELLAAPFGAALFNALRLEDTSRQAMTDPLTGLANRAHALRELNEALLRHTRHGGYVAVVFVDLDGFKNVNDTLGHAAGDHVLIAVAARIATLVRHPDTPARWGGDEFVIICHGNTHPPNVDSLADRLIHTLPGRYPVGDGHADIGVSIGIALTHTPAPAERLLAEADTAMYQAKRAGGNHHVTRLTTAT